MERSTLRDGELAQGLAYKLLAEQGADAQFTLAAQQQALDGGQDTSFLLKVFEHLERLREDEGIKLSPRRLAGELEKVGATASAVNLARAQPVYLQALAAALLQAEQRYGQQPASELDYEALVEQARQAALAGAGGNQLPHQTPPPTLPLRTATPEVVQPECAELGGSQIPVLARQFTEKRVQDKEWDAKTCRQARFIFTLFARYMQEMHGLDELCSLRQSHLADFDRFLRGLHANFGKSTKDPDRSIAEILTLAGQQVAEHGALQGATRNRHLTFLGQLIAYSRGRGLAIDPALTTTPFRARKKKRVVTSARCQRKRKWWSCFSVRCLSAMLAGTTSTRRATNSSTGRSIFVLSWRPTRVRAAKSIAA